jgi:hypothetical protein
MIGNVMSFRFLQNEILIGYWQSKKCICDI